MRIIKNRHKVEIEPIKFKTDTDFEDVIDPLPSKTFFMALIGKPASGKSTLMSTLLTMKPNKDGYNFYRKKFDNIFFIMPKNSLENLPKSHQYNKHIAAEPTSYLDKLNYENLQTVMNVAKKEALDDGKTLLVIDDEVASLKNPEVVQLLQEIAANRRHYGLSVCILTQVFNTIPLVIRKMLSHCFLWKLAPKEFDSAYNECFFNISKEDAKELCNYCWTKFEKGFIFVDMNDNRFYNKNFDEVLME